MLEFFTARPLPFQDGDTTGGIAAGKETEMKATATTDRMTATIDRVLGYTGLFVIGAMAWTCDRLGVRVQGPAARPAMAPVARGAR